MQTAFQLSSFGRLHPSISSNFLLILDSYVNDYCSDDNVRKLFDFEVSAAASKPPLASAATFKVDSIFSKRRILKEDLMANLERLFASLVKPPQTDDLEITDFSAAKKYKSHLEETFSLLARILHVLHQLQPLVLKTDVYTEEGLSLFPASLSAFLYSTIRVRELIEVHLDRNFKFNRRGKRDFKIDDVSFLVALHDCRYGQWHEYRVLLDLYTIFLKLPMFAEQPPTSEPPTAAVTSHLNSAIQQGASATAAEVDLSLYSLKYDDYLKKQLTVKLQNLCWQLQAEFNQIQAKYYKDADDSETSVASMIKEYQERTAATLLKLEKIQNIFSQLKPFIIESGYKDTTQTMNRLYYAFECFSHINSRCKKCIVKQARGNSKCITVEPEDHKEVYDLPTNFSLIAFSRMLSFWRLSDVYEEFLKLPHFTQQPSTFRYDDLKKQLTDEVEELFLHLKANYEPDEDSALLVNKDAETREIFKMLLSKRQATRSLPKLEKIRITISQLMPFSLNSEQALVDLFLCISRLSICNSNLINSCNQYFCIKNQIGEPIHTSKSHVVKDKTAEGEKEQQKLLSELRDSYKQLLKSPQFTSQPPPAVASPSTQSLTRKSSLRTTASLRTKSSSSKSHKTESSSSAPVAKCHSIRLISARSK